jgi:hypothetical protein
MEPVKHEQYTPDAMVDVEHTPLPLIQHQLFTRQETPQEKETQIRSRAKICTV